MQIVSRAEMFSCGYAGLWDAQGYRESRVVRVSGEWSGLVSRGWSWSRGVWDDQGCWG